MEPRDAYSRLVGVGAGRVASARASGWAYKWLRQLDWLKLGRWAVVSLQLGLLTAVVSQFRIESPALYQNIALITFGGFLIHSVLPMRYRLSFFLLLSLAGIVSIFGWVSGGWLIALGVGLIGICHLPCSLKLRVLLLVLAGLLLAALRLQLFPYPWYGAIWPILGSMFMFRMIIYWHDLQHEPVPPTFARTLSYFFLLPNVVFPLFPVVDYSTFRRTYYDDDEYRIYQRGLDWMLRGVGQLLLYKVVYYYLVLAPWDVTNVTTLTQFLVANFLLYLRVSGDFHLAIGILHLFGFHLPETNHRYLLATSFVDFWRRINIYWREFVMKLVYYPVYFRLRKGGMSRAVVIATLCVFAATWFLHAYQWFWILGSILLTPQDLLFWVVLGVLLVVNSLYELRRPKKAVLGQSKWGVRELGLLALRTVGTMGVICVLWSFWTSPSIEDWVALWAVLGSGPVSQYLLVVGVVGVLAAGAILYAVIDQRRTRRGLTPAPIGVWQPALLNVAILVLLVLTVRRTIYSHLGSQVAAVIEQVRSDGLNNQDETELQRGYYEQLTSANLLNSQLWDIYMQRPPFIFLDQLGAARLTGDYLMYELNPSVSVTFLGRAVTTNRWGMRDRDYEKARPANTFRIALLGPSHTFGNGVANNETYENVLEDRFNRELGASSSLKYEILNFAFPGNDVIQHLMILENKALDFQPSMVMVTARPNEQDVMVGHIAERLKSNVRPPYEYLDTLIRQAGVTAQTSEVDAKRKLNSLADKMIGWAYRQMVQDCRARGIVPVLVYLPLVGPRPQDVDQSLRMANDAGFITLDLSDVYQGNDYTALTTSESDSHPNAQGHRLIANRLYQILLERQLIPTQFTSGD